MEVASLVEVLSITIHTARTLKRLYKDYKNVPTQVERAKQVLYTVEQALEIARDAESSGLPAYIPPKLGERIRDCIRRIEDGVGQLQEISLPHTGDLKLRDRAKWMRIKDKQKELLARLNEDIAKLEQSLQSCFSISNSVFIQKVYQQAEMSNTRGEQMLQQMLALKELTDTFEVESTTARALQGTGVEALDPDSETATLQPHSPFSGRFATDKTLRRAIPSFFSLISISWWDAVLTCRWDRYKAKWEFSARVPLPMLLKFMFLIKITVETRARHWGFESIKMSNLRFMSSVNCTNELWQACAAGNLQDVQVLIEEKRCDPYSLFDCPYCSVCLGRRWIQGLVSIPFLTGENLLAPAVRSGNRDLVKYLLAIGIDPAHKDIELRGPLFEACRSIRIDIARDLVNGGACLDDPCRYGGTVLDEIISESHIYASRLHVMTEDQGLEFVDFLSAQEFSHFDGTDTIGNVRTPLQRSAIFNLPKLHYKIRSVMRWSPTKEEARQIFAIAAVSGCVPVLEDILSNFPDVDLRDASYCGIPALCALLRRNYPSVHRMIEILLDRGVDSTVPDEGGDVALHEAARWGQPVHILERLIECGADVEATTNIGSTPMHCAALSGNAKAMRVLHRHGANVNTPLTRGCTPLHIVVGVNYQYWIDDASEEELDGAECEEDASEEELVDGEWNGDRSGTARLTLIEKLTAVVEVLLELGADPHLTCCMPSAERIRRLGMWSHHTYLLGYPGAPSPDDARLTPGELISHLGTRGVTADMYKTALYRHMERQGRADEVYVDEEGDVFWTRCLVEAEGEDALACTSSWDFEFV